MTEKNSRNDGKVTALDSVRRLEETLDDNRDVERAAEARLAAAREEAERMVREARETARRGANRERSIALARADEEAERILREARERAENLRALAEGDRAAAGREVVSLVLPGGERGA